MLHAAIDIGTNTVLLLLARVNPGKSSSGGPLTVLREEQRMPRLGQKVDADKRLHPDSIARVMEALEAYQRILEEYRQAGEHIASVTVTATSAVRDAANRSAFLEEAKRRTGWTVRLLDGDEEARFTYRGAQSVLSLEENAPLMVLDIGGGSTETAYGYAHHAEPLHFRSVNAGCVRFTERYLSGPAFQTAPDAQVRACFEAAQSCFAELHHIRAAVAEALHQPQLAGVAGTLTSLAAMHHSRELQNLKAYDAGRINGISLSRDNVRSWRRRVYEDGPVKLQRDFPLVMEGRADIFLAGLIILEAFMDFFELPEVSVSTGGIRHGAVLYAQDDAARS